MADVNDPAEYTYQRMRTYKALPNATTSPRDYYYKLNMNGGLAYEHTFGKHAVNAQAFIRTYQNVVRGQESSNRYLSYNAQATYVYNNRNLVTKSQSYDIEVTNTLTSRYRYDDKGQLSEMTDYSVSSESETAYRYTEYSYDTRGRITTFAEISQNAQPTADEIKAQQIRYTYNEDGNLSKVSYPTTKDGIQSLS